MSEPVFPRRMWATYDEFTGWGICSNKPIRDWSKEVVAVDALHAARAEIAAEIAASPARIDVAHMAAVDGFIKRVLTAEMRTEER